MPVFGRGWLQGEQGRWAKQVRASGTHGNLTVGRMQHVCRGCWVGAARGWSGRDVEAAPHTAARVALVLQVEKDSYELGGVEIIDL